VNEATEDVNGAANGLNNILNGLTSSEDNSKLIEDDITNIEMNE
jgi:hypothetical protein